MFHLTVIEQSVNPSMIKFWGAVGEFKRKKNKDKKEHEINQLLNYHL